MIDVGFLFVWLVGGWLLFACGFRYQVQDAGWEFESMAFFYISFFLTTYICFRSTLHPLSLPPQILYSFICGRVWI